MTSCSRFSGLNNGSNYNVVGVYPNPTKDLITIQTLGTDASQYQWSLINSEGKIQKITPLIHTSPEGSLLFQFSVKSLPSGLYYIKNLKSSKENSIRFIKG